MLDCVSNNAENCVCALWLDGRDLKADQLSIRFSNHLESKEVREKRQLKNLIKEMYEHRIGPTDYEGVAIRLYGSGGVT